MSKKSELAYEKISDGARFREQYRFAFSVTVIATVFVVPTSNELESFLKLGLGISAFFAALFLICSAARVKYSEPGRLYEVFYVNERFRMWAYDQSLHVFAAAVLFFVGLIITGLIDRIPGVELSGVWSWIVLVCATFIIGLVILLVTNTLMAKKSKKKLPEI